MRCLLLPLSSSSRSLLILRPFTSPSSQSCPPLNQLERCFGSSRGQEAQQMTRAPSTAEEFKRVAEEKLRELREAEQSVASQTFEKTYDATEEAALGDGKPESVKERYKHHEPGADCRKRTHDDD
ncbi:PREDICTED: uncharacterized protein LOC101302338 [Fragaria vesca subsp. vesca]|uniref:uncharacterized protein LOC101302338 n=1 Tax=Fragaria vesca subsp. vesca TaxID=101020 RepID=UPI0002C37219|nr:PREDICTED: uncharacterized protein LOC101302338 [Fragaria vesca subsp. vesca]